MPEQVEEFDQGIKGLQDGSIPMEQTIYSQYPGMEQIPIGMLHTTPWAAMGMAGFGHIGSIAKVGYPQGAAISPLLSTLMLRHLKVKPEWELIMYADDGIIYSEEPIDEREVEDMFRDLGLELNRAKSREVQGDLKFLGLRLNEKGLWSETRSGTKMLMDGQTQ